MQNVTGIILLRHYFTFFLTNISLIVILIKDLSRQYRGLVKWYDRGLQNLWWEFDSLIPCNKILEFIIWIPGFFNVTRNFGILIFLLYTCFIFLADWFILFLKYFHSKT